MFREKQILLDEKKIKQKLNKKKIKANKNKSINYLNKRRIIKVNKKFYMFIKKNNFNNINFNICIIAIIFNFLHKI